MPAFVVNGTSLETDVPHLAFWMAAIALFTSGRLLLAAAVMVLAAMTAFQAVFLTPILWVYCWLWQRKRRTAWAITLIPPATIAAWQFFEHLSTGALPASVLAGYFQTYAVQAAGEKLRNAAGLAVHACFLVFPALLLPTVVKMWRTRDRDTVFLAAWIGIFFTAAMVVFFAGSARYLLPIAAPVALLASRLPRKLLAAGFGVQMALSLGLATANFQHWDGYRQFAEALRPQVTGRRVWINGEWALRYYLGRDGGLVLQKEQPMLPGEIVVTSELAYPVQFTTPVAPLVQAEIRPWMPLRLIGLESRSGYSTVSKGFWPFGISTGLVDCVRAEVVLERKPVLEYVAMTESEQLVTGFYGLEDNRWRWMAQRGVVLLKSPAAAAPLSVEFLVPNASPARRLEIQVEGRTVAERNCPGPGTYKVTSPPLHPETPSVTVTLVADRAFSVAGDRRELSVIITGLGFRSANNSGPLAH